jgi:alkylation response protein AidB-like acyl-CoA dehydrogenase
MITYPAPAFAAAELPELLRPLIEKLRDAADQEGSLPTELFDELRALGAFRLLTPRELGGHELSLAANLEVLENLGRIDGAVALVVWNLNFGSAGAYLDEAGIEHIWSAGPDPIIANSGQPGRIERTEDGGYLLSGEWKLVSGIGSAEWVRLLGIVDPASGAAANQAEGDGAAAAAGSAGPPEVRFCYVPRAEVTVHDTWHTFGMRGTNSDAISVDRLPVPAELSLPFPAQSRIDRPAYQVPLVHLVFPGCAAVVLGMARAAVDELSELASTKKGDSGEPLTQDPRIQALIGRSLARLGAAGGYLRETAGELDRLADAGMTASDADRGALRGAICLAAETAREVLVATYQAGSSNPIYTSSRLGRIFADGMVATQHANLAAVHYELAGRTALGLPPNALFV